MKTYNFAGVAMYPAGVPKKVRPIVGVWIAAPISSAQRQQLMDELNRTCAPGHVGVRVDTDGTIVSFVGKLPEKCTPRKMATLLAKAVAKVTGFQTILRQLRTYAQVSRALAPV